MIHTASLVHDDILDKADTRRGKKAVNQRSEYGYKTIHFVDVIILLPVHM